MKQTGRAAPTSCSTLSVMIQEKDVGWLLQLNLVFQDLMLLEKKQKNHVNGKKIILVLLTTILPHTN